SILPPAPYATGSVFQVIAQRFPFKIIPPLETSENLEFHERIQRGFQIGLRDEVDLITGIASILVKMGEAFSEHAQSMKFSWFMLHPKIITRLIRAWFRSKKEKRGILPKDLWPVRAIATGGVDTAIYKEDLTRYWGSEPYEFYGSTEVGLFAMQAWNKKWLTFSPSNAFLEFIPEEESLKYNENKNYQPTTVLLNEVKEGKLYEIVITQFYGMPLLRYPLRDLFRVVSLKDDETGIDLPQVVFQRRVGETINIGGMAELDEKAIWRAIANTGIKYTDWSACKEYDQSQSYLRLYLELKEERESGEIATIIDEQIKVVDTDYKDIERYLGFQPVRVTLLSSGTFQRYIEEKRSEGADLAHLKPSHINPPEAVIQRLLCLSEVV
ncbi:GH3 auxin-responsive promoter family protein, partial [Chloroflexota bacterium]